MPAATYNIVVRLSRFRFSKRGFHRTCGRAGPLTAPVPELVPQKVHIPASYPLCRRPDPEVVVEGHPWPLVLEEDARLDLSALQLQPATIVVQGKGGLIGANNLTKRKWTSLRQVLVTASDPALPGTAENPLRVTGTPETG